jgi:hypothetical protein
MEYTIGIDFGGVLSIHTEHSNSLIDVPGAKESLELLSKTHKLYIISFCGRQRAFETFNSIKNEDSISGQFYVKDKKYKKYICDYLGCDIMIDDREEILDDVKLNNPKIITILFGNEATNDHYSAKDWVNVINIINTVKIKTQYKKNIDHKKYVYNIN